MDDLKVQIDTSLNNQQIIDKNRSLLSGFNIIFPILGLIILIEIVYAVVTLNASSKLTPPPLSKNNVVVQKPGGKITLSTLNTNIFTKQIIPVLVTIDTSSYSVGGVDVVIHFDPSMLEATSGAVIKGKIFDDYPLTAVDSKKGLVSISGVSSMNNSFSGIGLFATVNFKAKIKGTTSLTVDFTKGSTMDSNLVDLNTSKDILDRVSNLDLTIQ